MWAIILMNGLLLLFSAPEPVQAGFHDQGVAACSYCHVMHNSEDGQSVTFGIIGSSPLLVTRPSSDLCLNCHATNWGNVMSENPLFPSPERGPGNFAFLNSVNINDGPDGLTNPISGDNAGHNINAPGYGLSADGTFQNSPGGTYPSSQMKCTSCHDPHGNQNYRMLRGVGHFGQGTFNYPAPVAVGLPLGGGSPEANDHHVAYIRGMSLWCANCHQDYLDNNHAGMIGGFEHPVDEGFGGTIAAWYNQYNGTLDPIGGVVSSSYLAAVPFEDAGNAIYRTTGPTGTSNIMCLSCHRAHASSAPHAGRWDFNVATLGQDGAISGSYPIPNPYPDPNQQPLCFKCHETGD